MKNWIKNYKSNCRMRKLELKRNVGKGCHCRKRLIWWGEIWKDLWVRKSNWRISWNCIRGVRILRLIVLCRCSRSWVFWLVWWSSLLLSWFRSRILTDWKCRSIRMWLVRLEWIFWSMLSIVLLLGFTL
jgi:hypothetical protein